MAALMALCFWLTSLNFGSFRPENSTVTFVLWALSMCVVLGTLALGFLVFRNLLRLYVDRRAGILGSRIRTKLVLGVLALSAAPTALHVYYSIVLLNRNLDKWFSQPTVEVLRSAERMMDQASEERLAWLREVADRAARSAEAADAERSAGSSEALRRLLDSSGADYVAIVPAGGGPRTELSVGGGQVPGVLRSIGAAEASSEPQGKAGAWHYAAASLPSGSGAVVIAQETPDPMAGELAFMQAQVREWQQLEAARPAAWRAHAYTLAMITLFMLFIAVWLAQFVSKQITRPVEALVTATGELAGGHLDYRVETAAADELAALVASFNRMGQALEGKTRLLEEKNRDLAQANAELDDRQRIINAIFESITTGVVSISASKEILKFNESARKIAEPLDISALGTVTELLGGEDRSVFERMFSSASRTGLATREFEIERRGRPMHLAVTVSSLDPGDRHHGFVVVLEDTTELMRAQRSEAWREVARRVAHEIKNPLTPISLAAGTIDRLLDRHRGSRDEVERAGIRERLSRCTSTIQQQVESLRALVDSFSHLARFPAIRPEEADINELTREAVGVFEGRLPDVTVLMNADPSCPRARVDPEPFKRALINLIDNAAEALKDSWIKEIVVSTRALPDSAGVVLTVADSGPGISAEDKERLFLPYYSTKRRGTGLGLPIVRSIVQGHQGSIRVEDNRPTGSRFIIEVPATEGSREAAA